MFYFGQHKAKQLFYGDSHINRVYLGSNLMYEFIPQQGVIYVNPQASGNQTGTSWTDAYTSIYDAMSVVEDNSIIWVKSGTYEIDSTISGYPAVGVKIYGGFLGFETSINQRNPVNFSKLTPPTGEVVTMLGMCKGWVLDGFIINSPTVYEAYIASNLGPYSEGTNGITFINCIIALLGNATPFQDMTVTGENDFSLKFINCILYGQAHNGPSLFSNCTGLKLVNSTYVCVGNASNYLFYGCSVDIVNSILYSYSTASYGYIFGAGCTIKSFSYNSVYYTTSFSYSTPIYYDDLQTEFVMDGTCYVGDPGFVQIDQTLSFVFDYGVETNNDFRLLSTSPCRDSGLTSAISGYDTDFDFNPRINNNTVDIGAHEYQS
jgi:hypothetical protein